MDEIDKIVKLVEIVELVELVKLDKWEIPDRLRYFGSSGKSGDGAGDRIALEKKKENRHMMPGQGTKKAGYNPAKQTYGKSGEIDEAVTCTHIVAREGRNEKGIKGIYLRSKRIEDCYRRGVEI